jgi:epoxyqueuosine reductase
VKCVKIRWQKCIEEENGMADKKRNGSETRLQKVVNGIDIDLKGVARVRDITGTRLEKSVTMLLPSAKSIVVLGMEIYPEFLELTSSELVTGTANLNNLLTRHVESLRGQLNRAAYEIARESHRSGLKALPLPGYGPAVDSRFLQAVISYKHAAEAAGLGRIGMSSLLVTHKFGPRVSLTLCLTEAVLESTANNEAAACHYCNVCVLKCPAQALSRPEKDEPYKFNKFACRTYIEASGGCSECQRVCPVASPKYN